MRRTFGLMLAVPAAIALLSPSPAPSDASDRASHGATVDAVTSPPLLATPAQTDDDPEPDPSDDLVGTSTTEPGASDGVTTVDPVPAGPTGPRTPSVEATFLVAPVPESGGMAGTGPVWRYTVEVEPNLDVDPAQLASEVRAALHDPRSWARDRTMQQVADPSRARIRVVLAVPATVDELCARVGLDTAGIYSCWNGRFAVLNAWRWDAGAEGFPDLVTYRTYLVNHEVGHGLGFGHEDCPGPGELAPVMMQQSKGLNTCVANGWPHP